MFSYGERYNDFNRAQDRGNEKRRMRACDMCRRRKVRCDGGMMPGNKCNNCIAFKYKCTYIERASKRVTDTGYIESLETQLAEMRKLLNKHRRYCPNDTFDDDSTITSSADSQSPFVSTASGSGLNTPILYPQQPLHAHTTPLNTALRVSMSPEAIDSEELDPDDEVSVHTYERIIEALDGMTIHPRYEHYDHFLGKSSSMMFLQTAMDICEEYAGSERVGVGSGAGEKTKWLGERRPVFWSEHPWVVRLNGKTTRHLVFPDADLIDALVELYFIESNLYKPLLHRPTFEKSVREGLHLRDANFGCLLLLVCAVSARYSDDPRVLLDDQAPEPGGTPQEDEDPARKWKWLSAGWKWFLQVQDFKSLLTITEPTLIDLQILCLASIFMNGSSSPHTSWGYIGVGLRYAQDLGAHRKKVYNDRPTVENELQKRAFWILLFLDRAMSLMLGRPCGVQDEEIDVDLPIACDDEYWINPDPKLAFKQPEGKPSTVTFFNCILRLTQIQAFALRTVYSINQSKVLLGLAGPKWEQHIVAELDSAMNRWIDSVPDHLRWNPHMENPEFLSQSALLYASYYALQITVHRPFIPSPRKQSGILFPSLAICTNAARSCIHVLDVHAKRVGCPTPYSQAALFSAGIVLLVNIWGAKRSGSIADPVKEMIEVHRAMDLFKMLESRWYSAGRIWDILSSLASAGGLPLPQRNVRMSHKRARSSGDASETSPSSASTPPGNEARHIAGTRRVQQYQQQASSNSGPEFGSFSLPGESNHWLPIHSDELGRLPLHPSFDSSTNTSSNAASPSSSQLSQSVPIRLPNLYGPIPSPSSPQPSSAVAGASGESLDAATIEAILSMLPPVSYKPAEGLVAPGARDAGASYPQSFSAMLSDDLENMMAQTDLPGVQNPAAQDSPDDGTLAMWSNAPSGFEWDDWSTYVNTFDPPGPYQAG